MAYRKLEVNDSVRITGTRAYDGKYHGQDGIVLEARDHAAKVRFYDNRAGEGTPKELWFYNRNLVVTRDSPDYVAPAKQTTPNTLTKEIKMSTFKIGDKVRVTGHLLFARWAVGKEGTIYHIDGNHVHVSFDGGHSDYGYDTDLELVDPAVPVEEHKTLAQKLDALDKLTAEIRAMVGLTPSGSAL